MHHEKWSQSFGQMKRIRLLEPQGPFMLISQNGATPVSGNTKEEKDHCWWHHYLPLCCFVFTSDIILLSSDCCNILLLSKHFEHWPFVVAWMSTLRLTDSWMCWWTDHLDLRRQRQHKNADKMPRVALKPEVKLDQGHKLGLKLCRSCHAIFHRAAGEQSRADTRLHEEGRLTQEAAWLLDKWTCHRPISRQHRVTHNTNTLVSSEVGRRALTCPDYI